MRELAVWVVITDGLGACICSNRDGVTTLVPNGTVSKRDSFTVDWEARFRNAYGNWYDRGRDEESEPSGRSFATELAAFLRKAACEHSYDGIVVIATPRIADELQDALSPETRELMVGSIVRDVNELAVPRSRYAYN